MIINSFLAVSEGTMQAFRVVTIGLGIITTIAGIIVLMCSFLDSDLDSKQKLSFRFLCLILISVAGASFYSTFHLDRVYEEGVRDEMLERSYLGIEEKEEGDNP